MLRWLTGSSSRNAMATGVGVPIQGLPRPSGPYSVGFVDYEWEVPTSKELEIEHNEGSSLPSTKTDGRYTLARLYYPSLRVVSGEEWRGRSNWIPSPAYLPGYGYYLKMPSFISSPLFRWMAGETPLWAIERAPLLAPEELQQFPLVIFSHGIGGMRTTYSTVCTDLASHGCVVAALEHRWSIGLFLQRGGREAGRQLWRLFTNFVSRDGSASMSITGPDEVVLQYQHPPTHDEEAHRFRAAQLINRREEVIRALDLLLPAEPGTSQANKAVNLWKGSRNKESLTVRNDLISDQSPLSLLQGRLRRDQIALAGHSFGACTAIFAAQEDERVSRVLALDPWLFPLPHGWTIKRAPSTLVVCSETFHWPGNQNAIHDLLNQLHASKAPWVAQVTIKKSGHMDQSDMSVMLPAWLASRFRDPQLDDPNEISALNTKLAEEFIRTGKVSVEDERIRVDRETTSS